MIKFNYYITILILLLYSGNLFSQLMVNGSSDDIYKYQEDLTGSGIETVYICKTLSGINIEYESSAGLVRFFKYSTSLDDRQQIPNSQIETTINNNKTYYTLSNLEDSKGYYAEINGSVTAAVWIIDYSKHQPILNSITPSESGEDCEYLKLLIDKSDDLFFYTNNGGKKRITRKYEVSYTNLIGNETTKSFDEETTSTGWIDIGTELVVQAPLMNTIFILKGDQFAEDFNMTKTIESAEYDAIATSGYIKAEQQTNDGVTSDIGGSAPANVSFYAIANEPVTYFYTWYIYKSTDTENELVRYTDKDIRYEFKESGSYLIKLEIADKESKCVNILTTSLSISDFKLEIPNFMLLDGEHEFKVSYKSIIDFKCTIVNRWGNEIYSWTDPSKGWDGKYKGKYVSPGVYFYVITATGGDGKKHKRAGDINILKKK